MSWTEIIDLSDGELRGFGVDRLERHNGAYCGWVARVTTIFVDLDDRH